MMAYNKPLGDGPYPFDADGRPKSRVLTVFPHFDMVVLSPKPHGFQIADYIEHLNRQRIVAGQPAMTPDEEQEVREDAVAGIIEGKTVYLRPDPQNMPLAFRADRLLQKSGVSKRRISFLNVFNPQVRHALRCRGESWRIARLPTSHEEIRAKIESARAGIAGQAIYYYNATTGTRWLTCQEFAGLGAMDDGELRCHLAEIGEFCRRENAQHHPEIAFYMADESFTAEAFEPCEFSTMPRRELRAVYEALASRFREAVPAEYREDDLASGEWRQRMFSTLVTEDHELVREEELLSLSAEFHMQIQWLPGGRMTNGELVFDEVFEEDGEDPWEENAREFLYNLVREYEDLEYVNIGMVVNSLSRRSRLRGRRQVYIAVLKRRGHPKEIVNLIRMQKWGIREHLDDDRELSEAMFRSDEYTEFVLDRRLACRYLGMNIPHRVTTRKICERYLGPGQKPKSGMIWSPYFERGYIRGVATDKIPRQRYQDASFALGCARLLGRAAAADIILGRCDADHRILFDDGDEIVTEKNGMPEEIVVADQTGTFHDFESPLQELAAAYADPVNRRLEYVPDPEAFARTYLAAFRERFACIQDKFRRRRRAYKTLFKTRPSGERGCFADRWEKVLDRLDQADAGELAEIIEASISPAVGC